MGSACCFYKNEGRAGNRKQKQPIAVSDMPLSACYGTLYVHIGCTWSGFTGTISTTLVLREREDNWSATLKN